MKIKEKIAKAVDWDNKERTFHVSCSFDRDKLLHHFTEICLQEGLRLSHALNLFLSFHRISGSCSYKIVHIKKSAVNSKMLLE